MLTGRAAGESKGAIADAYEISVPEPVLLYRLVVDEAAVGAAHVDEGHPARRDQQPRMIAA